MEKNMFHNKHVRGSSGLEEAEKRIEVIPHLPILSRRKRSKSLPKETPDMSNGTENLLSINDAKKKQ